MAEDKATPAPVGQVDLELGCNRSEMMGQLTREFVGQMLTHCARKEHPPLTVWEAEQLARAWLLLDTARQVAAEQADEESLWCIADNIVEAHLQQELRRLTAAIEG